VESRRTPKSGKPARLTDQPNVRRALHFGLATGYLCYSTRTTFAHRSDAGGGIWHPDFPGGQCGGPPPLSGVRHGTELTWSFDRSQMLLKSPHSKRWRDCRRGRERFGVRRGFDFGASLGYEAAGF